MLNNLPGVTSVHSRFYDLSSKYYQTIGNHASYYKDALRFLGCVDIKDLPGNPGPSQLSALGEALTKHSCHGVLKRVDLSSVTWSSLLRWKVLCTFSILHHTCLQR